MQEVEHPISESWTVVVMSEKGVPEVKVQDHEHDPNVARKVIKGIIQKWSLTRLGLQCQTPALSKVYEQ